MTRKSPTKSARAGVTRRSFAAGAGAAGLLAGTAPFNIVRAQGGPLKIGVILPLSGVQAGIGQSCKRGADIAPALFKQIGYTQPIEIVVVDFETNVDTARARAERLIADGCNMLSGPFDSGAASAIAQVAEQKGVPFVINIAAAPQITEQGYKFVFRNFQTAPQIISRGLALFGDIFTATGKTPSTAVLMHINDTFGQANKAAIDRIFPTMNLPFKIVESIAYDPAAKDLSVEVSKAKATNADILMTVTRLNDAIILVREMVKQRWEPMGIISPGSPGMYEQQFLDTMGKYGDYVIDHRAVGESEGRDDQARGGRIQEALSARQASGPHLQHRLHLRGSDGVRRRAQARRLDQRHGARRCRQDDQDREARDGGRADRVRRQGPVQHHRLGLPAEPQPDADGGAAEGRRRDDAGLSDAELEPARLILLVINPLRNGEGSMICRRSSWY